MLKRVNKEIADLKIIYPDVEFNLTKLSDREYNLECNFSTNKVNIILDVCYPFKPPKLAIDGNDFFGTLGCSEQYKIKKTYGFDCFCCHSYLCSKNWAPSIRLDKIITQSFELLNMKKELDINYMNLMEREQRQTISINYVPDRYSANEIILETNVNYLMLKELYQSAEEENLIKYQELYNKFMSNPQIYCYHSYSEHPPRTAQRQFYPLCTCASSSVSNPEDLLVRIHRGLYEQPCNCSGGKRYFALRNAYEIAYKKISGEHGCFLTFNVKDFINRSNQPIRSSIIDCIELDGPIDKSYDTEWI